MSSGEIQSTIINLFGTYFQSQYWDFGETFYFTELAAYIHQNLATQISSFVIVPTAADAGFGDDFQIFCNNDEVFISTAQVTDIIIIDSDTPTNLRIR